MPQGIVERPVVAYVVYILAQCTVILCLSHIQVGHGSAAFPETVHRQFISLRSYLHCPPGYHALLPLIVEFTHSSEHLSSEIVLRLLYLSPHDFLCGLCLLHLTFSKSPVKDRNPERYADHLLIKQILICLREFRSGL